MHTNSISQGLLFNVRAWIWISYCQNSPQGSIRIPRYNYVSLNEDSRLMLTQLHRWTLLLTWKHLLCLSIESFINFMFHSEPQHLRITAPKIKPKLNYKPKRLDWHKLNFAYWIQVLHTDCMYVIL